MAARITSYWAAILLLWACGCYCEDLEANVSSHQNGSNQQKVPLYIKKARLYLVRRKAFEETMKARMKALEKSSATFASQLYRHHASGNHGNVLISPINAYASLAMLLTASQGMTKLEIFAALALENEGRGIHASLKRELTSLLDDDSSDDVNDNIATKSLIDDTDAEEELDLSISDLENVVQNDYDIDNSISYNTGQTQIRYSSGIKTSSGKVRAKTQKPDMNIRLTHGMFHSEEVALSQHFSNRLVSLYGAPPMAMQRDEPEISVNLWVDAATRGAVPAMLAAGNLSADTLLVLVNAFVFGGAWETNFNADDTVALPFSTERGDMVQVECMYRAGNYSLQGVDEINAKVLQLPYANARYSLFVFLPRSGSLQELEQKLLTRDLQTMIQGMPPPRMTIVLLPRFRLHSRVSLKSELQAMGVRKAFTQGRADLRRMTEEEKNLLFVNDFFQYSSLSVDEGLRTEHPSGDVDLGSRRPVDSSNDAVIPEENYDVLDEDDDDYYPDDDYDFQEYHSDAMSESDDDSSSYFIANRPFFFLVQDHKYSLVLLMGRVTNPLF